MKTLALLLMSMLAAAAPPDNAPFGPDTFANPPDFDRPWVYWFWKNGKISRDGITADLEAMQRVGIGGVIMMEVSLSVPPGATTFFSPEWRGLFKFAVTEANRLGLSISLNSAPGWTGSGGPWVTPEQSMQKVVFSETSLKGPQSFEGPLPQPEAVQDFYRDITVLAFPTPSTGYRIADIAEKALYERGPISSKPNVRAAFPAVASFDEPPAGTAIAKDSILDISASMSSDGTLTWQVPEGDWTVLRIGHTSTGQTNRPAPLPGLECDKLDPAALDAHFQQFIETILSDIDGDARKALVAVHLDSWEVGAQNWTGRFRDEFQQRRGYDILPFLPVMSGRVVDSIEVSERFLWDLRQTVSDMIVEYHGKHLRSLAEKHGLWFSVEPYDMTPCDDMTLGATGDLPMCEFWSKGFDTRYSVKEATSVAHVYGRSIVAAEAFTSVDRWLFHPATLKAQGDWAFCEGVNRFVIHRYIHQPFPQARPGLSLGPHGLHYERTQTWWEYSKPWHTYLARCQHVLRHGQSVADVLYLNPEGAPSVFQMPEPGLTGWKYDACTPEALLSRVSAKDGRIVLPDAAQYRMLVLPRGETMTPAVLEKVRQLVEAGVPVLGAPPIESPSLTGYPDSDRQVAALSTAIWDHQNKPIVPSTPSTPEAHDDLTAPLAQARWIWFPETDATQPPPVAKRYFRRILSLPHRGPIGAAHIAMTADNAFSLSVNGVEVLRGDNFTQLYSADVAFHLAPGDNVIAVTAENGGEAPNPAGLVGALVVRYADGSEITAVTDAKWIAAENSYSGWTRDTATANAVPVRDLGAFGMSPWGIVKTIEPKQNPYPDSPQIESLLLNMGVPRDFESNAQLVYTHCVIDGDDIYFVSNPTSEPIDAACTFRVSGKSASIWYPETGKVFGIANQSATSDGRTSLALSFEPTEAYFVVFSSTASGDELDPARVTTLAQAAQITGPWQVRFDEKSGGPKETVQFETLTDWSLHAGEAIRHYSGEAVYSTNFEATEELANASAAYLDLGRVEIAARVVVNGKDSGIAWKKPFRVDITDALVAGTNELKIYVVNLWPNRMIGDEFLEPDSDRNANGTLKSWPQWLLDGKPSPTGRHTFATWRHWDKDDALLPSGLLGPVTIQMQSN
jgi:hypothetical protein